MAAPAPAAGEVALVARVLGLDIDLFSGKGNLDHLSRVGEYLRYSIERYIT